MEELQTDLLSTYEGTASNDFGETANLDDDSLSKSGLDHSNEEKSKESDSQDTGVEPTKDDSIETTSTNGDSNPENKSNLESENKLDDTDEKDDSDDKIECKRSEELKKPEENELVDEDSPETNKNDDSIKETDCDKSEELKDDSVEECEKNKDESVVEEEEKMEVDNVDKSTDKVLKEGEKMDVSDQKNNSEEKSKENKEESNKLDDKVESVNIRKENAEKEKPGNTDETDNNTDSILKDTLTTSENYDDNYMDDDFDTSLLCPEVSMDIEEGAVNTNSDAVPNDGSTSPLLYEPIFSTLVDEMTGAEISFNLTVEEQKLRNDTYGPNNPIELTKVHCTACNVHLGSALDSQKNRFIHPLLKVLVCKECYHFYCSGEFEKDEDGSELYCRWCGQGGQVFCCSRCEYVFCKKCVRNNFGRKKMMEVNRSDEWECFRCDPAQLAPLRAHAFELFEYVRNETSRAATLNEPSFLTTDHSQCCGRKKSEVNKGVAALVEGEKTPGKTPSRKRRRNSNDDPDYAPIDDTIDLPKPTTSNTPVMKANLPPLQPNPFAAKFNMPGITLVPPTKKDGNSMKPMLVMNKSGQQMPRLMGPNVRMRGPGQTASHGFVKIVPGGMGGQRPPMRIGQARGQWVSQAKGASPRTPTNAPRASAPSPAAGAAIKRPGQMRHEWFEKTVRSTAKVNSNLSYTLTQLGRAQAQASTVEALAVVHNKLQEILSSSINSLIQIRKNLRTEFISGIKNIRFPPKEPIITIPDDDVVIVNNTTTEPPPLATLPSAITLSSLGNKENKSSKEVPKPSSTIVKLPKSSKKPPGGFLRVKSFSALQTVPSECITIPDDPDDVTPVIEPEKDPLDISDEKVEPEKKKDDAESKDDDKDPKGAKKDEEEEKTVETKSDDVEKDDKDTTTKEDETTEEDKTTKEDKIIKEEKTSKDKDKVSERSDKSDEKSENSGKPIRKGIKIKISKKLFEHLPKVEIKQEPVEKEEATAVNGSDSKGSYPTRKRKLTYNSDELRNPDANLKHILSARITIKRSEELEKMCTDESAKTNGSTSD
ncbi:unnamed protein product [Brassicogethes aeneus]|uniref:PHD-type domain-containing protein n=1 Tax=Brassicogethes aeneus TaxID=1431903 RepID=A0A9P0BE00_BRAAE|nr:unnamed protein product [Brassicogethes aeneus]